MSVNSHDGIAFNGHPAGGFAVGIAGGLVGNVMADPTFWHHASQLILAIVSTTLCGVVLPAAVRGLSVYIQSRSREKALLAAIEDLRRQNEDAKQELADMVSGKVLLAPPKARQPEE